MRIQHNIPALNSHRNLGINNAATSKNLEKLSSGYRINRAGDDAAGLAISEKMRGQIRGLAMAEQNTSMGINLIQTAEGGLNETHAILQRMRELAVQSSNGTYQDSDRQQITHEFEALKEEINRISESTHYNGIKLLDGSLGGNVLGAVTATDATGPVNATPAAATKGIFTVAELKKADLLQNEEFTIQYLDDSNTLHTVKVSNIAGGETGLLDALKASELANYFDITMPDGAAATETVPTFTAKTEGPNKAQITAFAHAGADITFKAELGKEAGVSFDVSSDALTTLQIGDKKFQFVKNASELMEGYEAIFVPNIGGVASGDAATIAEQLKAKGINATSDIAGDTLTIRGKATSGELVFQIGANGGKDQRVSLSVDDMSCKAIGKGSDMLSSASVGTIEDANKAIEIIDGATDMVSAQRAKLGALQNRLEHTLNNLGVTKENLTASESTIRDVDMAKEMMEFTKNNILIQASQAMLAQANQLPQGVLQLLR